MVRSAGSRLVVVVAAFATAACVKCDVEPLKSSTSPDGGMTLRLERRNCGATTGYLYEVVAVKKEDATSTTIFKFDSNRGELGWPPPWEDSRLLDIKWHGSSQVNIAANFGVRVYDERAEYKGVAIRISKQPNSVRAE